MLRREGWLLQRWEEVPRHVKSISGNEQSNKRKMKDIQENFTVSRLNTKDSRRSLLVLCEKLMLAA